MKKNLFRVLFGVLVFFVGVNVYAQDEYSSLDNLENGEGSADASVTVGEVATPVYNVGIYWNNLTFDWVYDEDTNAFGWAPAKVCSYFSSEEHDFYNAVVDNGQTLYTDTNCTEVATEFTEETGYYVYERPSGVGMGIEDMSENGQIVPSIRWTSEADYDYVEAEFTANGQKCISVPNETVYNVAVNYGIYSDATCSTETVDNGFAAGTYYTMVVDSDVVLDEGEISDSFRVSGAGGVEEVDGYTFVSFAFERNQYHFVLNLKNKTVPTTTPATGAKIGTVTVSIKAK